MLLQARSCRSLTKILVLLLVLEGVITAILLLSKAGRFAAAGGSSLLEYNYNLLRLLNWVSGSLLLLNELLSLRAAQALRLADAAAGVDRAETVACFLAAAIRAECLRDAGAGVAS